MMAFRNAMPPTAIYPTRGGDTGGVEHQAGGSAALRRGATGILSSTRAVVGRKYFAAGGNQQQGEPATSI